MAMNQLRSAELRGERERCAGSRADEPNPVSALSLAWPTSRTEVLALFGRGRLRPRSAWTRGMASGRASPQWPGASVRSKRRHPGDMARQTHLTSAGTRPGNPGTSRTGINNGSRDVELTRINSGCRSTTRRLTYQSPRAVSEAPATGRAVAKSARSLRVGRRITIGGQD